MLVRHAPDTGPVLPELHRRLRWIVVVVVLAFAALVGRLWQLQVVRGERYYQRALSNVVQERFLRSTRGKILDRNGVPLATNRPAFRIHVVPRMFTPEVESAFSQILALTPEEMAEVKRRVAMGRKRSARRPVVVLSDQERRRASLIEQEGYRFPGVTVDHVAHRYYPGEYLAAHLVGYMNRMTPDEVVEYSREGYNELDRIGRYGLERSWENYLRGKKGRERYVANARGQRIEDGKADQLISGPRFIEPIAGHNVVLTLDARLQALAERAVRPHAAAAVAIVSVNTGRVLALVSKPSFNPNVMTGRLTRAQQQVMDQDPRRPRIDKTLRQHYPPGSIFKFVTAVAALEHGVISEDEMFECNGQHEQGQRTFHCTASHGPQTLVQAIQHSCNVYFWKIAERVGLDRIAAVSRDFGFGSPTGLGLNGDVPGHIPTRAWYEQRTTFKIGYTLNAATGQGDVAVTIVQLAMAYAAMANGGRLFVPQVVQRIEKASGTKLIEYAPRLRRRLQASPEILSLLHRGMLAVVNEPGGTAHDFAKSERIIFAGKTGTAQVKTRGKVEVLPGWDPRRDHAWFAGYAPAEKPEIAIVVLIEHGGPGGKVASPVARRIIEGYADLVGIPQPEGAP